MFSTLVVVVVDQNDDDDDDDNDESWRTNWNMNRISLSVESTYFFFAKQMNVDFAKQEKK